MSTIHGADVMIASCVSKEVIKVANAVCRGYSYRLNNHLRREGPRGRLQFHV